ncbi:histidine kinase [Streptomyces sp. NBC_01525]|uniref:sensor histidine kinase n=1 Tax=Streptomyces sp. NBC_01525 TaxID=2903893 RepID=UPI0038660BB5
MTRRSVPYWLVNAAVIVLAALDAWLISPAAPTPVHLALTALACGSLALRRRFPLLVFVLTLPATVIAELVVVPFAALYTLADTSRNRRLISACAVVSAAVGTVPWPLSGFEGHTWTFVSFVYTLATAAAPVLLGQLVQARRDLALRLAEIGEVREHERKLHAQAVLARERTQLAREMHDVVSHQVSLIAVRAGALQVAAKDPDAQDAARTIRTLSVNTLDELRHMVTLLRTSGHRSAELTPQPTLADLRQLLDTSGIETEVTGELPPDISAPAQRAVYRTVQESLTNVRKHAPGARATVRLWHDATHFGVDVTNTPPTRPALPLPSSHHGLVGLGERAELLGGTLTFGPTPEGGYAVRLRAPRQTE